MKNPFKSETPNSSTTLPFGINNSKQKHLREFIAQHSDVLLNTLAMYVRIGDVAHGPEAKEIALEILSELTVEALTYSERYDTSRHAMAWLLKIGNHLVLRRKASRARQAKRGGLARDYQGVRTDQDSLNDDELLDRLAEAQLFQDPPTNLEEIVIANDEAQRLLAPLSADEQRVLYLAKVNGLDGDELAQELGISHGAARVRLTRALNKLREIWNK